MAITPDFQEPQIAAARAKAWHQAGEPLLTLEAARTWLNHYGFVLFAPNGGALGAPAPSLVEATLGSAKSNTTPADAATARTLVARLVGEGSALPLNLFGGPGDLPDFIVSAQAFPFVFTLRGDKGWKRPPETSGAVKVTPLALRVYELLSERGALTISAIVPEIGREVTESAIARSLNELWSLLRVIPVLQQGEGDTLWELTTTRFIKAVKAGANAGQPTALSALVSLFLTQAFIATEEEITGFLSPVTARSRVREVLNGLSSSRQLSEAVLNGKTVLYIPDTLPDFAEFQEPAPEAEAVASEEETSAEPTATEEGAAGERIRSFGQDKGRPQDRNLRGKPVRREPSGDNRGFAARPSRDRAEGGDRPARRPFADRGDRPVRRDDSAGGGRSFPGKPSFKRPARRDDAAPGAPRAPRTDRPNFSRPWDEERAARPRRPREEGAEGGSRPARPFGDRPSRPSGDRPARPFGDRPARPFGDRPARPFGDRPGRPPREDRGDRPARPFADREGARPPRRDFGAGDRPTFRRRDDAGQGFNPERRNDRPAGDRPQRPYRPRTEEGGDRPFRPRTGPPREGGFAPRRDAGPRPAGGADRPFRRNDRPASGEENARPGRRPPFGGGEGRPPRAGGFSAGGRGEGRPARPGGFGAGNRGEGRPPRAGGFAPGGRGPGGSGFRSGPGGRPGAKSPGRPPRADRPAPRPRPEDEA